jgi:hypothetical protein
VEAGDLVVERLRIGACLDQQDAESPGGEIRRQGTTAGSGADDDVFVDFIWRFDGRLRSTVLERLQELDQR